MKKFISLALVFILITAVFAGCSGDLSKSQKAELKNELEYYNKKALANIDNLLFTSVIYGEIWIKETFTEDEVNFDPIVDDGFHLGYLSTSGNVLILFSKEDDRADFMIEPYFDDLSSVEWLSYDEIKEIKDFSKYVGSSIDGAPHYGVMTIYGFDDSPELRFWYNIGTEYTAYLDYVYGTSEFTLVNRD